jgi:hypothetical protein
MKGKYAGPIPVSPFWGEPKTRMRRDRRGIMTYTVTPDELTPEGARWADDLTKLSLFLLYVAAIVLAMQAGTFWAWGAAAIVPLMIAAVLDGLYAAMLSRNTTVVFTPTEFRVKVKNRWLVYDRTLTHRFIMLRHDLAPHETERREVVTRRAAHRGQFISPRRYFAESFHIVFEYMGHRHDILDVYDQTRAAAVLARLKACDEIMDNRAGMGDGEAMSPDEQWGKQPGDLPS